MDRLPRFMRRFARAIAALRGLKPHSLIIDFTTGAKPLQEPVDGCDDSKQPDLACEDCPFNAEMNEWMEKKIAEEVQARIQAMLAKNAKGKTKRDLLWDALQKWETPPTLKELAAAAGLDPHLRHNNDAINQLEKEGLTQPCSSCGKSDFRHWPAPGKGKPLPDGFEWG